MKDVTNIFGMVFGILIKQKKDGKNTFRGVKFIKGVIHII